MGLLSRARQEREASSPPSEAGEAFFLPGLGPEEARSLAEELGPRPLLGLRCELSSSAVEGREPRRALAELLGRALGPEARFYGGEALVLAFASPRGDWDAELFELQIRRALALSAALPGLGLRLRKFSSSPEELLRELLAFAEA